MLTWQHESEDLVDSYIVLVEDASAPAPSRSPIASYQTHLRVSDLRSAHSYTFRVAAEGREFRRSEWTRATFGTEPPRFAPEPPQPPLIERHGQRECESIHLRMPQPPMGCGSPSEWALQYRPISISTWLDHHQSIATPVLEAVGDSLPANLTYTFRLVAHNAAGSSAPGEATEPVFLCRQAGASTATKLSSSPKTARPLTPLSASTAGPHFAALTAMGAFAAVVATTWYYRCRASSTSKRSGGAIYQRASCFDDAWEYGDTYGREVTRWRAAPAGTSACPPDVPRRLMLTPLRQLEVRMMALELSPHPIRMEIPLEDVCSVDEVCSRITALYTEVTGHDAPSYALDMTVVRAEGRGEPLGRHTSLDSLHAASHVLVTVQHPQSSSMAVAARYMYNSASAGESVAMPTTRSVGLPRAEGTGPWIEPQQQQPCLTLVHSEDASHGRPRFTL